jgi:hypothetical protein
MNRSDSSTRSKHDLQDYSLWFVQVELLSVCIGFTKIKSQSQVKREFGCNATKHERIEIDNF